MNDDTAAHRLMECFGEKPEQDITLDVLYQTAKGRDDLPLPHSREMQQYVGAYITKINNRIKKEGKCIKPGVARRTYRLEPITKE